MKLFTKYEHMIKFTKEIIYPSNILACTNLFVNDFAQTFIIEKIQQCFLLKNVRSVLSSNVLSNMFHNTLLFILNSVQLTHDLTHHFCN